MQGSTGSYKLGQQLGKGSFGEVYACGEYAVKKCNIKSSDNTKISPQQIALNEIKMLTQLNHDNIVKFYQVFLQRDDIFIVMERCDTDLSKIINTNIKNNTRFAEKDVCGLMWQIAAGYGELVKNQMVHRDIKPANILIKNGILKLADFGIAKLFKEESNMLSTFTGTTMYMAPQVLQKHKYTSKCDIWSMGLVFYQLLFNQRPWNGSSQIELLRNIQMKPLCFPYQVKPSMKKMIQKMLSLSEEGRMSFDQFERCLELEIGGLRQTWGNQFFWKGVKQMLQIQANSKSINRFQMKYSQLSKENQIQIRSQLKKLLKKESALLLSYLQW